MGQVKGLNYAVSIKDVHEFIDSKENRLLSRNKSICEPFSEVLDSENFKGQNVIGADTDCDNIIDFVSVDQDNDGKVDFILLDLNADKSPDIQIIRNEDNGPLNLWLIDENHDNIPDVSGIDDDLDFKPDIFSKLNN